MSIKRRVEHLEQTTATTGRAVFYVIHAGETEAQALRRAIGRSTLPANAGPVFKVDLRAGGQPPRRKR